MKKFTIFFVTLSTLVIMAWPASAAPTTLWFDKANSFYEEKQYDSAIVYYEKILTAGLTNSAVYYNLGNAYYRTNDLGRAILFYEKAKKLAPRDPDIENNIKFANLNILDRVAEPERTFFDAFFYALHTAISLHAQLWVLFVLLCFLSASISIMLFVSKNTRLWLIYLSVILFMISTAVGISAGYKIYRNERVAYAIVLAPSIDALNQPNGDKVLFAAHEGTKFRIRKKSDSWSLVSLPNGISGWVENSALGRI